jgi:uncharacterized protein (TIGR02646 family)
MIHVNKGFVPDILNNNKSNWETIFFQKYESGKITRPQKSQYAHKEIVNKLGTCNNWKCFYCEKVLNESDCQVDHFIELEIDYKQAFVWENLNLSCSGCNQAKKGQKEILVLECLNPSDENIDSNLHLFFDGEEVNMITEKGNKTIKKYNLKRMELNLLRMKAIKKFYEDCFELIRNKGLNSLTNDEIRQIESFANPDKPFSLMFKFYIEKIKKKNNILNENRKIF